MSKLSQQSGFSLFEVLVTVIVISFGAIGAAALQIRAQQFSHNAYLNTQATLLAHDMSERMRANPAGILSRKYHLPEAKAHKGCFNVSGCDADEMAENDMYEWAGDHRNSRIQLLSEGSAVVCIDSTPDDGSDKNASCDGNGNVYAIKIWWRNLDKEIERTVITSTFNYN